MNDSENITIWRGSCNRGVSTDFVAILEVTQNPLNLAYWFFSCEQKSLFFYFKQGKLDKHQWKPTPSPRFPLLPLCPQTMLDLDPWKTRLASSQWTRALFCLQQCTRYDHPIRQIPQEKWKKTLSSGVWKWQWKSSNGKTKGNQFDFEIAGLLWINLVRNIKGWLSSKIPCLILLESPAVWHMKFAYRMNMTIPVSIRFSLTQTSLRESNTNLSKWLSAHQHFSLSHREDFKMQDWAKVKHRACVCGFEHFIGKTNYADFLSHI